MCKWLSVSAVDDDGNPWGDPWGQGLPDFIEFDSKAGFEKTGYCTCWITKPEGKALLDLFVEQCIKPYLAQVSWGQIRITVH